MYPNQTSSPYATEGQVAPSSEISNAWEVMAKSQAELSAVVTQLENRLNVVLMPEHGKDAQVAQGTSPVPVRSPLADTIYQVSADVHVSAWRLQNLLERIAL